MSSSLKLLMGGWKGDSLPLSDRDSVPSFSPAGKGKEREGCIHRPRTKGVHSLGSFQVLGQQGHEPVCFQRGWGREGESPPRSPCLKLTLCFSVSVNANLTWRNLRLQLWVLVSFNSVKSRPKPGLPSRLHQASAASQPHACHSSARSGSSGRRTLGPGRPDCQVRAWL